MVGVFHPYRKESGYSLNSRNVINITIYDIDEYIEDGYETIAIFRSDVSDGTFTELTTSATRLILSSDTTYYHYVDEAEGISDYLYKYKLSTVSGTMTAFITPEFYGNTSDLVETLRYAIEDITVPYRYTDKELRRFVFMAVNKLQLSMYTKRFKVDFTGIISPRPSNQDISILLLQAMIEVNKSQITRAADTYMSFSDGRGRIEVKTALALRTNIKDMELERDEFIKNINRRGTLPVLIDMSNINPYYAYYGG
jgi:hypothetical protein